MRQKAIGACLYMPLNGSHSPSFEVIAPESWRFRGQEMANSFSRVSVSGSKLKEELGQSYSLFVTVISTLELHAILTY